MAERRGGALSWAVWKGTISDWSGGYDGKGFTVKEGAGKVQLRPGPLR